MSNNINTYIDMIILYNTIQYKSYLVYASYKKTVHWRITEFNIDNI